MKKLSLFISLNIIISLSFSQQNIADSLKMVIEKSTDIDKVDALCDFIEYKIYISDYTDIKEYFYKLENILELENDLEGNIRMNGLYGAYYLYLADYQKSIEYFYAAMKIAEQLEDKTLLSKIYINTANVYYDLGNFDKSKELAQLSLKICKENKNLRNYTNSYILMGNIYYAENMLDSSEYYYNLALDLYDNNENKNYESVSDLTIIYNNIAILSRNKGDFIKAIEYLNDAIKLNEKYGEFKRRTAILNNNLAANLVSQNKYDEALEKINIALKIAEEIEGLDITADSYLALSELYFSQGDYKNAYIYSNEYNNLKDSIQDTELNHKIAALDYEYNIEKQKQEIIILTNKSKIRNLQFMLVISIVSAISFIVILYLNRKRIKLRDEKLIAEQNNSLSHLELEKAQLEIKYKNKELLNFYKHIRKKKEIIEKFQKGIVQMLTEEDNSARALKQEELLKMKILSDSDWHNFKTLFSGVYQNFFNNMEKRFPDLTEGEKRQLILLKLGLPGKQAADTLGISFAAVQKARKRLADKLGLPETRLLKNIVNEISNDL